MNRILTSIIIMSYCVKSNAIHDYSQREIEFVKSLQEVWINRGYNDVDDNVLVVTIPSYWHVFPM